MPQYRDILGRAAPSYVQFELDHLLEQLSLHFKRQVFPRGFRLTLRPVPGHSVRSTWKPSKDGTTLSLPEGLLASVATFASLADSYRTIHGASALLDEAESARRQDPGRWGESLSIRSTQTALLLARLRYGDLQGEARFVEAAQGTLVALGLEAAFGASFANALALESRKDPELAAGAMTLAREVAARVLFAWMSSTVFARIEGKLDAITAAAVAAASADDYAWLGSADFAILPTLGVLWLSARPCGRLGSPYGVLKPGSRWRASTEVLTPFGERRYVASTESEWRFLLGQLGISPEEDVPGEAQRLMRAAEAARAELVRARGGEMFAQLLGLRAPSAVVAAASEDEPGGGANSSVLVGDTSKLERLISPRALESSFQKLVLMMRTRFSRSSLQWPKSFSVEVVDGGPEFPDAHVDGDALNIRLPAAFVYRLALESLRMWTNRILLTEESFRAMRNEASELGLLIPMPQASVPHGLGLDELSRIFEERRSSAPEMDLNVTVLMDVWYALSFTVLHELGHSYYQHTDMRYGASTVSERDRSYGIEAQADKFALSQLAFTLLPKEERDRRRNQNFELIEELGVLEGNAPPRSLWRELTPSSIEELVSAVWLVLCAIPQEATATHPSTRARWRCIQAVCAADHELSGKENDKINQTMNWLTFIASMHGLSEGQPDFRKGLTSKDEWEKMSHEYKHLWGCAEQARQATSVALLGDASDVSGDVLMEVHPLRQRRVNRTSRFMSEEQRALFNLNRGREI